MEFKSQRDYEITLTIYGNWPLVGEEANSSWNIEFTQEFNMTSDRHLFNQQKRGLPLYEGKMIHQYDAYYKEPRFWIEETAGKDKLKTSKAATWHEGYRFAYREIARSTDLRTCIATVLPPNNFANHKLWIGVAPDNKKKLFYVAILNSFCMDWIARFVVGSSVTLTIMKQLPLPRLNQGNPFFDEIVPRAARLTCITADFADLWQDAMGEAWDESKGATDPAERQVLRDEIDALVAHLYGLSREDFAHILGTFPLVFPDDQAGHQKMESLLNVYDDFAEVVRDWPRT